MCLNSLVHATFHIWSRSYIGYKLKGNWSSVVLGVKGCVEYKDAWSSTCTTRVPRVHGYPEPTGPKVQGYLKYRSFLSTRKPSSPMGTYNPEITTWDPWLPICRVRRYLKYRSFLSTRKPSCPMGTYNPEITTWYPWLPISRVRRYLKFIVTY